jgi:hypothetical protein
MNKEWWQTNLDNIYLEDNMGEWRSKEERLGG